MHMRLQRKVGAGVGLGLPLAVIVTWGWNAMMPQTQMPPEVSAALGAIMTTAVAWIVPNPN